MIPVSDQIRRKRDNIVIHSQMYYHYMNPIWSDAEWDRCAKELIDLQDEYPEESRKVRWYEAFKNFDGSTGMQYCSPLAIELLRDKVLYVYDLFQKESLGSDKIQTEFKKVRHIEQMYSLDKVHTEEELLLWDSNLRRYLGYK